VRCLATRTIVAKASQFCACPWHGRCTSGDAEYQMKRLLTPQAPAASDEFSGRYRLQHLAAEGGMGRVFAARRTADGCRVAIKLLHPRLVGDERCRQLMVREARALRVVRHPLVVELLECGETRTGVPFLALKWLDGRTLHSLIVEEAPLMLARVARLLDALLAALEVVHARGVVHADLKPENVMLVAGADGREAVRLLDFGVSSVRDEHFAYPGEVCGTPGYLSPEVLAGQMPTISGDVYAAGIVLYQLLTGRAPFRAVTPAALLIEQLYEPPPQPSLAWQKPASVWDALVAHALAPDPADRFASASEFRVALHAAVHGPQPHRAAGLTRRRRPTAMSPETWLPDVAA
jgi:serine/threonine-protein kinase